MIEATTHAVEGTAMSQRVLDYSSGGDVGMHWEGERLFVTLAPPLLSREVVWPVMGVLLLTPLVLYLVKIVWYGLPFEAALFFLGVLAPVWLMVIVQLLNSIHRLVRLLRRGSSMTEIVADQLGLSITCPGQWSDIPRVWSHQDLRGIEVEKISRTLTGRWVVTMVVRSTDQYHAREFRFETADRAAGEELVRELNKALMLKSEWISY